MKFLAFAIFTVLVNLINIFCYAGTGISPRKIALVTNQPLSGPAKEFSYIGRSSRAYFKYVNDQGGIHGRIIDLKIVDDQFKSEKSIKKISETIVKTEIFAVFSGLGNKTFQSVYPFLKKQKIPSFFVGSNLPEWTKPVQSNIFTFLPSPEIEARVLGRYLTKNHPGTELIIWYADKPEYLRSVKSITNELYGLSAKLLPGKKGRLKAEWNLIEKRKPDLLVALGNFHDLMQFLKEYPKIDIPVFIGHALADSRITKWLDIFSTS
jgi:ABC-type branched-chain amino acid transport systems, periplasmic component